MFDVAPTELLVLGTVALLVIPPKDLPKAMRVAGYWMGKARGVARQFRSGFDEIVRDAELAEMEKRWAEENARIMREHSTEALVGPLTPEAAEPWPAGDDDAPRMTPQPVLTGPPPESDAPSVDETAQPSLPLPPPASSPEPR